MKKSIFIIAAFLCFTLSGCIATTTKKAKSVNCRIQKKTLGLENVEVDECYSYHYFLVILSDKERLLLPKSSCIIEYE